jgi:hypothetical protein
MRVRVSLDFDILIESFISLCIIYQKTSKALGVSYTSVHHIMNGKRPCKSNRPKERAEFFGQVRLKYTWLRERFYR